MRYSGTDNGRPVSQIDLFGWDVDSKRYTYDSFNSLGQRANFTGSVAKDTWTWSADRTAGATRMLIRMVQRFTADRAVTWKDRDIDGQHALDDGGDWPGEARPVAQGRELPKAVLRDPPIAGERVLDNVGDQIDDLAGSHQLTQFYGHDRYAATQPPMFLDIACNNYRAPAY